MSKENSADDKQKHPDEKIFWFVAIGFIAMIAAPGIYAYAFKSYDFGGPADWGAFATYFSGIVTPIVALCSAVLFFRSILVQRDEFEKTRKEMESAKRHQIGVEETRNKLARQEQIERAITHAEQLRKSLFINLHAYDPNSPDLSERKELSEKIERYFSRSENVVAMLTEYLDCDGDIYLVIDYISGVKSEFEEYKQIFIGTEFNGLNIVKEYEATLSELLRVRSHELDRYAHQRSPKEPQSA